MTTLDRFEHPCFKPGCTATALYGYDCDMRKGIAGTWACAAHRGEIEAARATAKSVGTVDEPKQGSLL